MDFRKAKLNSDEQLRPVTVSHVQKADHVLEGNAPTLGDLAELKRT